MTSDSFEREGRGRRERGERELVQEEREGGRQGEQETEVYYLVVVLTNRGA